LYVWLLETALWLTLLAASVVGYHVIVPMMQDVGAVLANEFAWRLPGALVLPGLTFLVLAVTIGPLLILVDLRNAVRRIEARAEPGNKLDGLLGLGRREPTM
jgi:hypothetical protein